MFPTAPLKKRTLTNLYARPRWLADAHEALDAPVAAAYGWSADISDEDFLGEWLALNSGGRRTSQQQRRARREARGVAVAAGPVSRVVNRRRSELG